jgi:hypothetical protein
MAPLTIPGEAKVGDTSQLRMEARSQGDPNQVNEQIVRVLVVSGGRLYLPSMYKNSSAAQSSDANAPDQAEPPTLHDEAPPSVDTPAPTSGDKATYLPLVPLTPTDTP